MNKIKVLNTNLTTMDAEVFNQIKILATKLNKNQNELLEEAARDLIKKYKQNRSFPNQFFDIQWDSDKIIKGVVGEQTHKPIVRGGSKPGWAAPSISPFNNTPQP